MLDAEHRADHRHEHPHWTVGRVAFLALSVICIYFFAPSIAEVFSAYDRLGDVQPIYLLPATACAVGSFASVWLVQALALGTRDWFSVSTTQLAGNAFNRITPGGGATGTALQANMLADAGFGVAHAATALTVQSVLSTASIVALPLFALPFILVGHAGSDRSAPGVLDRDPGVRPHGRHRHRAVRRRWAAPRARPRGDLGPGQAPPHHDRRSAGRSADRGPRPHPARDRSPVGARAGGVARALAARVRRAPA